MAKVQKSKKALTISIVFIPIILIGLLVIHWFVYPFTSASPNFADVEATFNKLQIPSDWQVIEESENRGIAGRQCGIEDDGCFSVGRRYLVPTNTAQPVFMGLLRSSGCISPAYTEREVLDGPDSASYECASGAVRISGSLMKLDAGWEASVYASSR